MKTLEDIFVPYEIAKQLKEIGFDEKCIASYTKEGKLLIETEEFTRYNFVENLIMENFNLKNRVISAPSYEQVFKWFREKGYIFNVFSSSDLNYIGEVFLGNEFLGSTDFFNSYQQAREALILKLIEIYKNEQNI